MMGNQIVEKRMDNEMDTGEEWARKHANYFFYWCCYMD